MANEEKKSYYELLKDPRWQRKRLEIMKLTDFACEYCESKDSTLHVHHSYYEKGLNPWEYPDQSLHCLCEKCHKQFQDIETLIKRHFGSLLLEHRTTVLGYLCGLEMDDCPHVVTEVIDYEMALGIGHVFGLEAEEILDVLEDGKIDGWKLNEMSERKNPRK